MYERILLNIVWRMLWSLDGQWDRNSSPLPNTSMFSPSHTNRRRRRFFEWGRRNGEKIESSNKQLLFYRQSISSIFLYMEKNYIPLEPFVFAVIRHHCYPSRTVVARALCFINIDLKIKKTPAGLFDGNGFWFYWRVALCRKKVVEKFNGLLWHYYIWMTLESWIFDEMNACITVRHNMKNFEIPQTLYF